MTSPSEPAKRAPSKFKAYRAWAEWDNASEIYWLKFELPAMASVRGWNLKQCYRNYLNLIEARVRWWHGVETGTLRALAEELLDSPPQTRQMGDRQVIVDGQAMAVPIAGVIRN